MSKPEVGIKIGVDIALVGKENTDELYIIRKKEMEEFCAYKATGLTPNQIQEIDKLYAEQCRKLAELKKDAPPCKVGDTIWEIYRGEVRANAVIELQLDRHRRWYIRMEIDGLGSISCSESEIGKTLFLLPAEAQEALERQETINV